MAFSTSATRSSFGASGGVLGGLWGLFLGAPFVTTPVVAPVLILSYLAGAAIEGAIVVGGPCALGAALWSVGVPQEGVIEHETAVKADEFLVMAHGAAAQTPRAKGALGAANASQLDVFAGAQPLRSEMDLRPNKGGNQHNISGSTHMSRRVVIRLATDDDHFAR